MGGSGNKSPATKIKAMTEDEYLGLKGLADASSGWVLDKLRSNRSLSTVQGKKRFRKEFDNVENEYQAKRAAAKQEYKNLVAQGKLRDKTRIEKLLTKAQGHEDNPSVQAARRLLAKRGINWKNYKGV